MNLASLFFFVEIAKERNITKTAKRLHISQQALSQHLQKLESYYGTKLFNRKPQLSLTYAGELLYECSQTMLLLNNNISKQLQEVEKSQQGVLKVGASSNILHQCLPAAVNEFHKRWPNVMLQFNMDSYSFKRMKQQLDEGTLDIVVHTHSIELSPEVISHQPKDSIIVRNQFCLVVPNILLQTIYGQSADTIIAEQIQGTDLTVFHELPYILLQSGKFKRNYADKIFLHAGYTPKITMEISNTDQLIPFIPLNLGAFFCDEIRVASILQSYADSYSVFPIVCPAEYEVARVLSIETDIHHYQQAFAQDFISIIKKEFASQPMQLM